MIAMHKKYEIKKEFYMACNDQDKSQVKKGWKILIIIMVNASQTSLKNLRDTSRSNVSSLLREIYFNRHVDHMIYNMEFSVYPTLKRDVFIFHNKNHEHLA